MLQVSSLIATLVREARWTLDSGKFPENDYTVRLRLCLFGSILRNRTDLLSPFSSFLSLPGRP
jgi:hypothetical protein